MALKLPIKIGLLALVTASAPAFAQAVLEEVIVTATKRGDIDVQSVAGGIYAVGGDSLDVRGITNFENFAGQIPGLSFQDLGPGDKEFIIRGINGNGPAVVGAYFDEYVITASDQQDGGGKNAPIKMIDLERVEVLNGPQGTLYGANSMAGNIRYIARKPDASGFDAFVDSDFSDTKEGGFNYTVSGMVNIPLSENFAMRLVGWRTDNDGWIDQPRLENGAGNYNGNATNINDEETNGGRLQFRWTPSDSVTVDFMAMTQDLEAGGSPRFTAPGSPAWPDLPPELLQAALDAPDANPPAPLPGLPPLTPTEDFINVDITNNPRDDEINLIGATFTFESDIGTTTVSASQYEHDIEFRFDSTPILLFFGVPAPAATVQPQSYDTSMVEVRFASSFDGPLNFVGGAYYQRDDNQFQVQVPATDGNGNPARPWDPSNENDFFAGGTTFFGRQREDEVTQTAVFGEFTYTFADRWEAMAGGRVFSVDQKSIQQTLHNFGGSSGPVAGEQIGVNAQGNAIGLIETTDDTFRPKFSLSYQATDDVLLYTLYSEGFRVGGVNNANQPFAPGIPATFDSDELTNFEFGFKSNLLGNRMLLNATVFLVDWDDIQVEPRDPVGNIPFTTNGGSAEVNGIEWALRFLATDNLRFDFTGTYFFDAQLTTDQPVLPGASSFIIQGQEGDDIPNIPELQLYGSATWEAQIGDMPLQLIGDVTYRDDTNTEFRTDSLFNIPLDSYTLVNLYANLQITENFGAGVYVRNVTDELAVFDGIATFQDPMSIVAAQPRTIGAVLRWQY
ncbi:TonB-dependent receptor [Elongatibacter sediminis]|uniref:TonB-dependent receptor n=1 Tax=Elongatibacter sediminis TaxID=3119006 RepID=A0AAW9RCU8_9GAMM